VAPQEKSVFRTVDKDPIVLGEGETPSLSDIVRLFAKNTNKKRNMHGICHKIDEPIYLLKCNHDNPIICCH